MEYSSYLPDELLLEILALIEQWETLERQQTLARFCKINRQFYDVGIRQLYDSPYLVGRAYELFVRTVCPSVLAHIKHSPLAGLVRVLDLSHIVHHSNKSTTARLLGRTKTSLEIFIAPQASFAINCWASLSKCSHLRILDLSLVSECISFQSLNQTIRQLSHLRDLRLPRCSSHHEGTSLSMNIRWPPILQHLTLSGSVSGQFLWDMLRQPYNFPPTMSSLSIVYAPHLDHAGIKLLLGNLGHTLTVAELRDLPSVKHGRLNDVLEWLPKLRELTIALDYIGAEFGRMPEDFGKLRWRESKPLEKLTLVTSGATDIDPAWSFTAVDLYAMIDERWLGRLRYLNIAESTEWAREQDGAEIGALDLLITEELDRESWIERRWHYEGLDLQHQSMPYERWIRQTRLGREMRPHLRVMGNC
ncbi:hypothetical protein GQ44DRAFT_666113 [Phaeosphaeriaceae sp. PMI808]|nr:hypothetical protein GQ44DRAFT_666113 [Phaeosphaeriaceae sp. PMI808]